MRRAALFLLLSLSACGEGENPLAHAITAFRAGDRAGVEAARAEAEEAIKAAPLPTDLCKLNADDVRRYSEAGRIAKLDDQTVLAMSEESRLVWALAIAGNVPSAGDDARLAASPLYKMIVNSDGSAYRACADHGNMAQSSDDPEAARADVLKGWTADMKSKLGADYDQRMAAAASNLTGIGYVVHWPVPVLFGGDGYRPQ